MSVDIDPKLCFVLMPMEDKFMGIYQHVIKPTVTELELNCLYARELFGARPIMKDVWEYCEKARVVIAELSGCNSNVYYEAGYSHAFDSEKVIFITQDMDEVTFDIQHFRCIVYDPLPGGIEEFKRLLTENIKAVVATEPESPRLVTRIVEKTIEVSARPDERTRQALELLNSIEAMERGQPLVADEATARLLELLEQARITLGDVEFLLIPAGDFTAGRGDARHDISVAAFYIGKYPVTNAQYKRFVGATKHEAPPHWSDGIIPKGKEAHPVVCVTWHDARTYCKWLSEETAWVVRLPTEAEWEKAARGIDGREYPWGDEFDKANCNSQESSIGHTTRVAKYSPQGNSPYGVVDTAGNVWECTSSLYHDYPYDPKDGREDPEAEGERTMRGGAFNYSRERARCSSRRGRDPMSRGEAVGFRVALLLD